VLMMLRQQLIILKKGKPPIKGGFPELIEICIIF